MAWCSGVLRYGRAGAPMWPVVCHMGTTFEPPRVHRSSLSGTLSEVYTPFGPEPLGRQAAGGLCQSIDSGY